MLDLLIFSSSFNSLRGLPRFCCSLIRSLYFIPNLCMISAFFMGTFRQITVGSLNAPVQSLSARQRRARRLGRLSLLSRNFSINSFWNYNFLLLVVFSHPFFKLIILFKLVIVFLILFYIGSPFC